MIQQFNTSVLVSAIGLQSRVAGDSCLYTVSVNSVFESSSELSPKLIVYPTNTYTKETTTDHRVKNS